jgi:hypothetical protein
LLLLASALLAEVLSPPALKFTNGASFRMSIDYLYGSFFKSFFNFFSYFFTSYFSSASSLSSSAYFSDSVTICSLTASFSALTFFFSSAAFSAPSLSSSSFSAGHPCDY